MPRNNQLDNDLKCRNTLECDECHFQIWCAAWEMMPDEPQALELETIGDIVS